GLGVRRAPGGAPRDPEVARGRRRVRGGVARPGGPLPPAGIPGPGPAPGRGGARGGSGQHGGEGAGSRPGEPQVAHQRAPAALIRTANEAAMEPIIVTTSVVVPREALSLRAVRSGGPGGQNVNKVSSKVELRVDLDAIVGLTVAQQARL